MPDVVCWMPAGQHEICAGTPSGEPWIGKVVCDEAGALAVAASFAVAKQSAVRCWLDCNHDDGEAVADVTGFSWDSQRGIVAQVQWTPYGETCLRERRFASFSPAFLVNKETGRVSGVMPGHALGGLVNAPAFGAAMPALIAARLAGAESIVNPVPGGSPGNNPSSTHMNKEQMLKILAALGVTAPADANDTQLAALVAQHADKLSASKTADAEALKTLRAELDAVKAKANSPEQADAIKALKTELDAIKAREAEAKKVANAALVQAAIDRGAITEGEKELWIGLVNATPDAGKVLAAMKGQKAAQASVVIVPDVAQKTAAEGARILRASLSDTLKGYAAERDHKVRARIYADGIAPIFRDNPNFHMGSVLASNSLGSLSGDLIVQRSLTLLKLSFPMLSAFSTDFTSDAVALNQTVKTRLRSVPSVASFVAGTGYATSGATTTDVDITINQHKGVPISFNANELASTSRDLFGEQVEGAQYALGKTLVDAVYALLLKANFANETVSTLNNFARSSMTSMASTLSARGVPMAGRFALLSSTYFDKLGQDGSIVSYAAFQRPELITEYMLPRVAGFQPYEAPNLITTNYLQGFAGTADALAIATRVPNDYTQVLPGANNGSVSIVTNPDTGVSVQLVQYVDHNLAAAFWRIALMYGVAVGQAASGQRLVSQATT